MIEKVKSVRGDVVVKKSREHFKIQNVPDSVARVALEKVADLDQRPDADYNIAAEGRVQNILFKNTRVTGKLDVRWIVNVVAGINNRDCGTITVEVRDGVIGVADYTLLPYLLNRTK